MAKRFNSLLVAAGLVGVLLTNTGCPNGSPFQSIFGDFFGVFDTTNNTDDTDNTDTNDNNDTTTPTQVSGAVKTSIAMHVQAKILAGDDMVVFGTGATSGVGFIVPSAGDTTAREIPNSDNFRSYSFAVGNDNIFLVDGNFQVTVYNTTGGSSTTFDAGDIRLKNIPSSAGDSGHIQADGAYCATLCEESETDDGNILKVIDTSSGTPTVISFTQNPADFAEGWEQVAVNAATQTVVAVIQDEIYLYDITQPTAEPVLFEPGDNGVGSTQIAFDGTYVVFQDDAGSPSTFILDTGTGTVTPLTNNPSAGPVACNGGSFGYFVNMSADDSNGSDYRGGIGTSPGPGATLATVDDFIDGSTTNNGQFGFGQTMSISPNGDLWVMGGSENVGSGEYLQVNDGSGWSLFADSSNDYGCPGTDVSISGNTIAFKSGSGSDTVVAYFILSGDGTIATSARVNP
ncbi:MAG: hypothetical protein JNG88_16715 [Phycisphaerales bacterium]|nr:hypothetical protein [Phycisphaerales bacterium]